MIARPRRRERPARWTVKRPICRRPRPTSIRGNPHRLRAARRVHPHRFSHLRRCQGCSRTPGCRGLLEESYEQSRARFERPSHHHILDRGISRSVEVNTRK